MSMQSARPRARTMALVRRCDLDVDGCVYGQLTRERLNNATAMVQSVDRKVNYILAAVGLQLFGFLLTVVGVLVYRVGT